MDRLIALLAALVALISLGGALIVHNNATAIATRQAAEIAQLKASLTLINQQSGAAPRPVPASDPAADGAAEALLALQTRVASLEDTIRDQASALEAAQAALANPVSAPPTEVALAQQPSSATTPAAFAEGGPTDDCIPLGTRFMAQAGDSFPICKTNVVIDVADVTEGSAMVQGAAPIAAGGFGNLAAPGCTLMVFSADSSGFAELRVSCV